MSYLKKIDTCIDKKVPVFIVGWEHCGEVLITKICFDAILNSYKITFIQLNSDNPTRYSVHVEHSCIRNSVYPTTIAGKVLFG